jgi:tetratricopeptide (TPR) repeat protein
MESTAQIHRPLSRLITAGYVPWFYLFKTFLPVNLMVIYPQWEINPSRWMSYVPVMVVIGGLALFWWKRNPWGRLWFFGLGYYLVALSPVLGFIDQRFNRVTLVADHWQYYAIVAPITLVIAAGESISRRFGQRGRYWGAVAGTVLLMALGVGTWRRSCVYANEETLWWDNVAKNPNAWMAHYNLGNVLGQAGRKQEAILQYEQALRIKPNLAEAQNNLGSDLQQIGKLDEAMEHFDQALRIEPDYAEAHDNLGFVLFQLHKVPEAKAQYEEALRLKPDLADAHRNLGNVLVGLGNVTEAIQHFEEALRIKPDDSRAHCNLGVALLGQAGRVREAIGHLEQALRIDPGYAEAHSNLGVALAQMGETREAMEHFEQALRIKPDYAQVHYNLAIILEQAGRPQDAI